MRNHRRSTLALVLLAGLMALGLFSASIASATDPGTNKFKLFGDAKITKPSDPAISTGHGNVLKIDNSNAGFGGIYRKLGTGLSPSALDNTVKLDYFFKSTNCGLGTPRVVLVLDTNESGVADNGDKYAFGYIGDSPNFTNCTTGSWVTQNLTSPASANQNWDLSPLGGSFYNTWAAAKTYLASNYPGIPVVEADLVQDNGASPNNIGVMFADNITLGNRTFKGQL